MRSRLIGDTSTISSTPTQNSQTIDGLVTGDLTAAGDQGDRQALADPSITALSAPVTVDVASAATTSTTTFAQVRAAAPQTTRDTTAPTVSLTAPTDGATVSGTVTLDRHRLRQCPGGRGAVPAGHQQLAALGAPDKSSPYGVSWNTTTVANGTHTLTAQARDAAGNIATSTVTVTVDNTAPTVSLTAPTATVRPCRAR